MSGLRKSLKTLVFKLLGKEPEAVVLHFWSGDATLARRMSAEVLALLPDRRHYLITSGTRHAPQELPQLSVVRLQPASTWSMERQLRRQFRHQRIGMSTVLFTADADFAPLRRAACLLAPRKVLAYNTQLERHHLRLSTWIASWLFLRGVPLDRIYLRPKWLCPFKRDRTVPSSKVQVFEGRPPSAARPKVAVVSPYFPYPLSHGGAVRIYNLLRDAARDFDIYLLAFAEQTQLNDAAPVMEFCAKAALFDMPRYREPRWASVLPPEVHEFRSELVQRTLERWKKEYSIDMVQVEYTPLATYGGDVLVEHDVTFDLYAQVREKQRTLSARWDFWRWHRFESQAARRFARVVFMSEKDAAQLPHPGAAVIANGVDVERYIPRPEPPSPRLLFIGSFRHFPNIVAYQFLVEQVWPLIKQRFPALAVTVVAGPDYERHWREHTRTIEIPRDERIRLEGFVRDVRPLYAEATLVVVPTLVSAGTNVKVLEAMAMERAVVSTPSGCAGIAIKYGESVWIGATAQEFAEGIARLLEDAALRRGIASNALHIAHEQYDWRALGAAQRRLWKDILASRLRLRLATADDLEAVRGIQDRATEASHWDPARYLDYSTTVALCGGVVAGFLVARRTTHDETEILNLAVAPEFRRRGVATRLMMDCFDRMPGTYFLEVRASNTAAQALYAGLKFAPAGRRPRYYDNPVEDAVVMRRESC
ncbi:MAG: GNAT family N-acetyltransferase [Acidobacteriales bacterium]|nr:GNAT family N-acetyltransferase [Terriglobales bacterium]